MCGVGALPWPAFVQAGRACRRHAARVSTGHGEAVWTLLRMARRKVEAPGHADCLRRRGALVGLADARRCRAAGGMPVRVRRSGAWHECQAWRAVCGVSGRRMGRSAAPYGLFRAAIRCVPWLAPLRAACRGRALRAPCRWGHLPPWGRGGLRRDTLMRKWRRGCAESRHYWLSCNVGHVFVGLRFPRWIKRCIFAEIIIL